MVAMEIVDEDNGDDIPVLSSGTQALLQSFYADRDERIDRFANFSTASDVTVDKTLSMDMFSEDWNASQFWYSDETATKLARQLLEGTTEESSIAVVSAPSVLIQLKNLLINAEHAPRICLLEYDERFNVLGDFVRYDYQKPCQLPVELKGAFDRILCDPPFFSSDCQTKFAITTRWLSNPDSSTPQVIVCTGESMKHLMSGLYPGLNATTFEVIHNQGRLKSEYVLYANFECKEWSWQSGQT